MTHKKQQPAIVVHDKNFEAILPKDIHSQYHRAASRIRKRGLHQTIYYQNGKLFTRSDYKASTKLFDDTGTTHPVGRIADIDGGEYDVILTERMTLIIRERGRRQSFEVHLRSVKTLAMCTWMGKEHDRKMKEYNDKKKLGYKGLKLPRRPQFSANMIGRAVAEALK